ncbi:hypothetical protein BD414DRAFT_438126 [Trametes punicea]|nr:hypothetical protein BD414DRAFT_438126 [Trametes punicea]
MPRRPRPATRNPPKHSLTVAEQLKPSAARSVRGDREEQDVSESESSSSYSEVLESVEEELGDSGVGTDDEQENLDEVGVEPDAPRVAQWVDEEELDELSDSASGSEEEEEEEVDNARLEADLRALPFGALRKAQKALAKAHAGSETEDEASDVESGPGHETESTAPAPRLDKGKGREQAPEKEIPKRKNKHAPMEMSSKRPVPRMRFVDEHKVVPRDPRFLPITGEFDRKRFHTQYGFLAEMHEEELKTLKENLKRARKLLANSPRNLREERQAEVERLERAVKRAESLVNKDRQEKVQLEALSKAAKEEREKRKQGKKAWYMKNADKKALLLRAKYDALAATGGRGAVRKAIEKKQKKISQKEKKRKPNVGGTPPRVSGEAGQSRKRPHGGEGGPRKRSRAS